MANEKSLALKSTIVFVSRLSVRLLVVAELKARGVSDFIVCESVVACLAALRAHPFALLVADTEQDERELVNVLRGAQGRYRIDTRPIYFIAYAADEKILSYALEYNILQLHIGEFSKAQVEHNLNEILLYAQRTPMQVQIFDMVIKARKNLAFDEAYALLESLCKAEPENIQASGELAAAMCDLDLWDRAVDLLIGIVARYPFDTRAKHLLARCYMKRGDFNKARYHLEQASLLSPFNAERLCDLARIFLDQFKVEQALGTFKEALALDPDLQDASKGRIQCELLLGEANDALKVLRQLQNLYEFASVFNGAAIVAIRANRFQQGIGLYKTSLGCLAENPTLMSRIFFNMGLGLYKWGKGKLAVSAFEKAIELDASNDKAKHNARLLVVRLRRLAFREGADSPFSGLNSIESIDDFDELGEETFAPLGSGS